MGLMMTSPVEVPQFWKAMDSHKIGHVFFFFFLDRKKSFICHCIIISLLFLVCRFTSTSNTAVTANCFCQCSCNAPQKQFHKCFSWKGYVDNVSSARLTAHSAPIRTISGHIHSHVHSHRSKKALTGWPLCDPSQQHVSSVSGFHHQIIIFFFFESYINRMAHLQIGISTICHCVYVEFGNLLLFEGKKNHPA